MICCLESENPDTNHKKRRETEKFKLVISSKISTRFSRQHSQRFFFLQVSRPTFRKWTKALRLGLKPFPVGPHHAATRFSSGQDFRILRQIQRRSARDTPFPSVFQLEPHEFPRMVAGKWNVFPLINLNQP